MLSPDAFADPPAEFRPMPFWFWNTRLKLEDLLKQVFEMYEQGCGGFFIHARFGLETEYLGEEWFRLVGAVCEAARELRMQVWLYDEQSFPSGLIGGRITERREWRAKFVDLSETQVHGPCEMRLELPGNDVASPIAFAIPTAHLQQWPAGRLDLTGCLADGALTWQAPEGAWSVMAFSFRTLDSDHIVFGVDYLDAEAMAAFFEGTFRPYEEHLAQYFGDPIQGIFTDEPTLLPWHHDASWYQDRSHRRVTIWTERIAQRLREQNIGPAEVLPALFYDTGPTAGKLRRAYWETVLRLYEETYFAPYRAWCDAHGLELTGHLLLEEGLYNNTLFQADPTRTLRHMHRPGADHLGTRAEGPYGGGHLHVVSTNLQGMKLVGSVAHITGRQRVMTESFGCGGWAMTLEQMKRIVDWQWALGLNFLCPHAVFSSIEGFRKTDAPPCPYHNPQWEHYRQLSDYVGRLSYLLSQGRPVAQIGLVYPIEAFQREYAVGVEGGEARRISDTFDHLCGALQRLHYDFEIVPRWALEEATLQEDGLRVGEMTVKALIWPFAESDDALHDRLSAAVPVVDVDDALGADLGAVIDNLAVTLHHCKGLLPEAQVTVDGACYGAIKLLRRRLDDGELCYLANVGDEEVQAEVTLPGAGPWTLWDCETGEVWGLESEVLDGRSLLRLFFTAGGTWVLSNSPVATLRPYRLSAPTGHSLPLPDTWRFRPLDENALPLDELVMTHRVLGGGQEWRYRATFAAEHVPEDLSLVFDDIEYRSAAMRDLDLSVRVNGQEWHPPQWEMFRWPELKRLRIAQAVHRGDNELEIVIRHQAWQDEPKVLTCPPKLVGAFGLRERTLVALPAEVSAGSWTESGLPYYSGRAEYACTLRMPDDWSGGAARLELDGVGAQVAVTVNGQFAGVRCWRPWHVEIGALLHPGENELALRIANTMANFLESTPAPSGLLAGGRVLWQGAVNDRDASAAAP